MKKIWFYGGVMALFFLWVFPALASTTSQTLTAQGRALLFNNGSPTVPGLQQAVGKFKSAIQADPNDREARFFSAVSNILLSATQNSGNTVITTLADLAKSFGVNRNANTSLLSSPYDEPPMLNDAYNPPANIPDGSQLQTFLAGPFLDLLTASLADLSVIDSQESTSPFKLTLTASELGELAAPSAVDIDYGDVLLLEAGLRAMKSVILITNAYDMKCSLRDIIVLNNAGIFQIERDLAEKYKDLMSLKPDGSGAAELTKARTELIKLIDNSRAAMDFIKNKNKRGTQGNHLFTFASQSAMDAAQLKVDGMTEIEKSLNGNRPAILTWTESFNLKLDNGNTTRLDVRTNVNGKVDNANDIWFSGGTNKMGIRHIDTSSYSKTSTDLTIKLAGVAYEWDEKNQMNQSCNVSYTVKAGLSENNITGGSIAVTDSCNVDDSSFLITGGSVTTATDDSIGEIDLNRLFGNTGKPPPLDIRHYLPHFDARGVIINDGKLPTPALGGIFPEISDPALAYDSLVSLVPFKTITVDGNDADWQGINNIVNRSNSTFQAPDYVKIKNVKSSRDANYIYVMVRTAAFDTTKSLTVDASFYYGNNKLSTNKLSYDDGNGTTTCTLDANGISSTDTSNCKLVNNVAKLRLPIDTISDYSNVRLDVSTSSSSAPNSYDYFTAHILLPAHKDTGTVTCAANNGHGRIFITAYDGPAMNSRAFLGSAIMQNPGNFTIPLFARTANTYLYGWWDADDNGILSLGDYVGRVGPLNTKTQNIALNLNKRQMVDFTKVILPSNFQAGGSMSFSAANVISTDSEIISYEWNFGDSTTATGAVVNHTYQRAGDYQLTLKVKTKSGETDSRSTIVHVAEAAYKIDGAISGLANGKSITLYAYSASTGSYGFQSINGDGSSALNYYTITNLPPAPDYTLFINSADYPGGYYDGKDGLTNASQAATIDLSASDKQNVDFTLPSAKTLTVQLNGVKADDQIEVRAWSQGLGLMSAQTVTANGTSVTATMDNIQAQGNYVVYVRFVAGNSGNSYRDGYYQGENLQPSSLSQALTLPMTVDTAINISMGNGYKITGTIKGLAKGEIATVSAWSPGYRNGNAALITGTGSDINYTVSGLPSRPDYMVAIKVLGGGGGYYGGRGNTLTTYQNALPIPLTANISAIDLSLPSGHSISGKVTSKITGTGGGYAVVYAWSPSSGNYASTGVTLPGTYKFTNLPPASDYKVGVYARNYLNPTPRIVDISLQDQKDQDFNLTTGGAIIGTITVPSGTDNLRLMVCSAEHETCASLNLHAPLAGGDVNYFVPGLPAANDLILSLHLGNTVYFYDSTSGSYLTSDPALAMAEALTLAPGQVLSGINMDLSSLQTFSITGKVQGLSNADKDIAVIITAWNNEGGWGSVVRNGNGTYSIPGLPAGNYYLMATAAGYSNMFYNGTSWGLGLVNKAFHVTANTNINDLTLNKGYTVSGTLTGPDDKTLAGVYISAWDVGQKFGGGAVSLSDGTFKISGLPSGTYSLEVHCLAGDYEGTKNQLSADVTNNIKVTKEAGVISGKVTGPGRDNAIIFVYDNQSHYITAVVPRDDGNGNYSYEIDNLPATGTYTIKVDTDGNYNTMEWTGSVILSSGIYTQDIGL